MTTDHNTAAALAQVLHSLDASSPQPLYLQLQQALHAAIEQGLLPVDQALPAERQLAQDLGVSRITVRKAIEGLAQQGLLQRRQGAGNFVATRIDKHFAQLTSFSEDMRSRGRLPSSSWLRKSQGTVTPEEALKLAMSPGSQVYRFARLRFADQLPMAIETATVAGFALPSLDAVQDSLYDALSAQGHRPVRALQRLHALLLDDEQARLLHAQPRDAGLMVERLGYLGDGRAIELSRSVYRGDTYDFVAELNAR
jgi:GntR family transcriptional regulator